MTVASARTALAIVGATATGKTELAEALARELSGEVICADSRQLYRELEIGTGKPDPAERERLPHHLFDLLDLADRASAGAYAREATAASEKVLARGATPVFVGGSGLYLRALMEGLAATPAVDPGVRARLADEARELGAEALHARLATLDPGTAARLSPRDVRRVTRALEVVEASGRPLSEWHGEPARAPLDVAWRIVELRVTPRVLAQRIERRTRRMFEGGLVEETRELVRRGREQPLRALRAVGYDECLDLLQGRITRTEAEARTSLRTRQLAKRQRTWFRHQLTAQILDGEAPSRDQLRAAREGPGPRATRD